MSKQRPGHILFVMGVLIVAPLVVLQPAVAQVAPITIDYPRQNSIFPPDFTSPTFLWRDGAASATLWTIEVAFSDGSASIRVRVPGERFRVGEIDPRCVADTNELPKPTPEQAAAHTWKPDSTTWEAIKKHSIEHPATVAITGFRDDKSDEVLSRGQVSIETSKDPVGAPIFFRDVPLIPSKGEKGIIKPLPSVAVPLIAWRLRYVNEPHSHLILDGLPMCANCHSFSRDGKTLGMDLDGPENDKGLYTIVPVQSRMSIGNENVISWAAMRSAPDSKTRTGFMSQISPDGQYVLTMMKPQVAQLSDNVYTVNFTNYRFVQVFFPTRGGLVWYRRGTNQIHDLPGADDPRYVQTDGAWSPDGKTVVFARAAAGDPYPDGRKLAQYPNDPNETPMQYDLYRIPFNDGKGGKAEAIAGASQNGMSNTFPKVSPDGRWVVFVKCRNGQLMRPDSQLYIVPLQGGEARRLHCNLPVMNSWHSFSPNGRWLVFSSKTPSWYTQMYLTHLDEDGNDSPPILIENATAANRAVNIPEFLNIPAGGLVKIDVPAADFYRQYERAYSLAAKGQNQAAIAAWKKALEIDPTSAKAYANLGVVLSREGRMDEAITQLQKAVELSPVLEGAQNDLAVALWEKGSVREAIPHVQQALELNHVFGEIYEALAADPPSASAGKDSSRSTALNDGQKTAKNREAKREKLDLEYRQRLGAVMAYILRLDSPVGMMDFPQTAPSAASAGDARSTQPGLLPSADLFSRVGSPNSATSDVDAVVAPLEIPRLWKLADQSKNNDEAAAARRQILRIFVHTFETGNQLLDQKKYALAVLCYGVAAQDAPENPYIYYTLARALALNKQEKKALKTLEKAAEKGFNESGRVAGDQAFNGLRDYSEYRKAIAEMSAHRS